MGAARKLQSEIDRTLKKVQEGIDEFDQIWQKVHDTENVNQKEKFEADLKKEIKKLQRLRDQIKAWISGADIKDKTPLCDARKAIEREMERFKACEKEAKMKQFSKAALGQAERLDPREAAKVDTRNWINDVLEQLTGQVEQCEYEMEELGANMKKKAKPPPRLVALEEAVGGHKKHVGYLEKALRCLDNDAIAPEELDPLRESLEYYLSPEEGAQDFSNIDELYAEMADRLEAVDTAAPAAPPLHVPKVGKSGKSGSGGGATDKTAEEEKERDKERDKERAAAAAAKAQLIAQGALNVKPVEGEEERKPHTTPLRSAPPTPSASGGGGGLLPPLSPALSGGIPPSPGARGGPPALSLAPHQQQQAPGREDGAGSGGGAALAPGGGGPGAAVPASPLARPLAPSPAATPSSSSGPGPLSPAPSSGGTHPAAAASPRTGPGTPRTAGMPPLHLDHASSSGPAAAASPGPVLNGTPPAAPPPPPPPAAAAAAGPGPSSGPPPGGRLGAWTAGAPDRAAAVAVAAQQQQQQAGAAGKPGAPTAAAVLQQQQQQPQTPPPAPAAAAAAGPGPRPPGPPGGLPPSGQQQQQPPAAASPFAQQPPPPNASSPPMGAPPEAAGPPTPAAPDAAAAAAPPAGSGPGGAAAAAALAGSMGALALAEGPPGGGAGAAAAAAAAAGGGSSLERLTRAALAELGLSGSAHVVPTAMPPLAVLDACYRVARPQPTDVEWCRFKPRHPVSTPATFPKTAPDVVSAPGLFRKVDPEALFFAFYYQPDTYQQYLAAQELKRQSWRYHKQHNAWFQRYAEPAAATEEYEQGTYVYFDYNIVHDDLQTGWCYRRKENFTFRYDALEDELPVPAPPQQV